MLKLVSTAVLIAAAGSATIAGGIERHTFSSAFLFEDGNYVELGFGLASPSVSGISGANASGDMAPSFSNTYLAYKRDINDRLSFGLLLDQPMGANVDYPTAAAPYPFFGTTATLETTALTGVLKYNLEDNVSIYGGLRTEQVSGAVSIPLLSYTLDTSTSTEIGYLAGIAWEKPEIGARIALTYESERNHELDAVENNTPTSSFLTTFPQSLTLEFQTGVAKDTLLFGSIRWAEWSVFEIDPPVGPELVAYADNRVTYNLGLGRRFSDTWSGAVLIGHEPSTGSITGNLGPTDGYSYFGLAATYSMGNTKITGGVRYTDLGDATTQLIGASFANNSALSAGVRISYNY